jgi:hypothetical protein
VDGCGGYLVEIPFLWGGGTGWNVLGLPPIMCVWLRKEKKEGVVDRCGWYLEEIPFLWGGGTFYGVVLANHGIYFSCFFFSTYLPTY